MYHNFSGIDIFKRADITLQYTHICIYKMKRAVRLQGLSSLNDNESLVVAPLDSNSSNYIQSYTLKWTCMLTHTHTHTPTHSQAHIFIQTNRTLSLYSSEQHPPVGRGLDYWLRGAESPTSDRGSSWIQRKEGLLGNQLLAGEQ